jgi:PAS domain S-box-containing protein
MPHPLKALIDALPLGAALVDSAGEIIARNAGFTHASDDVSPVAVGDDGVRILVGRPDGGADLGGQVAMARRLLHAIGALVDEAVVVLNAEGDDVLFANGRVEVQTGVPPGALPAWLAAAGARFDPDTAPATRRIVVAPPAGHGPPPTAGPWGGAPPRDLVVVIRPIVDDGGRVVAHAAVITPRDPSLRYGEPLPVTIGDAVARGALGVVVVDAQRHITALDRGTETLTGYPAAALLGRTIDELTPEEDRERDRTLFELLIQGELPRYEIAKSVRTRAGERIPIWVQTSALAAAPESRWLRVVCRAGEVGLRLQA